MKEIVDTTVLVFQKEDLGLANKVEPLEEVIDYLNAEIKKDISKGCVKENVR